MSDQVTEALSCWAGTPTWFSSHPMDQKNFRSAVSNLKKLPTIPNEQEIYSAILFHVQDAPQMLGTPSNIEKEVEKFTKRILTKL